MEIAARKTTSKSSVLSCLGYYLLLLLVFSLPFELTQRHLFDSNILVITNLNLILYLVLGLAILSFFIPFISFVVGLVNKTCLDKSNFLYRQRKVLILFGAVLLVALVSSLLSKEANVKGEGLKWTGQLFADELLWLAVVSWLEHDTTRKINQVGLALVSGAVIAAVIGLLEVGFGTNFAESLDGWFKLNPTMAGPYVRLSGTFEYANVAAMYFELALPFALTGLLGNWIRVKSSPLVLAIWLTVNIVLWVALLLTLSRGAWFGITVGLLAMVVLLLKNYSEWNIPKRWQVGFCLTGLVGLVAGMAVWLLAPQVSLRLNSQSDQDWYKADYQGAPPPVMEVCQLVTVPVTVQNFGPLTWQATGAKSYNLSYHWLYSSGKLAEFEGVRSGLGSDVLPGAMHSISAVVVAPLKPGQYFLVWDMVQEDVTWFGLKYPNNVRLPVQINPLPTNQPTSACNTKHSLAASSEILPFTELPQVPIQPSRSKLWEAAVKMVAANPLVGVGPNGYRFNYGLFVVPPLSDWDNQIFANNFWLEIFADLGLLGGGLFLALLLTVLWPLITTLSRRQHQGIRLEQIAIFCALVAFFAHGFVDYILGSHAINILFWVLLGLAATVRKTAWKTFTTKTD